MGWLIADICCLRCCRFFVLVGGGYVCLRRAGVLFALILLCLLILVLICCVVDFVCCAVGVGYGWYSRFGLGGFLVGWRCGGFLWYLVLILGIWWFSEWLVFCFRWLLQYSLSWVWGGFGASWFWWTGFLGCYLILVWMIVWWLWLFWCLVGIAYLVSWLVVFDVGLV